MDLSFDDLIPQRGGGSSLSFDDLIPAAPQTERPVERVTGAPMLEAPTPWPTTQTAMPEQVGPTTPEQVPQEAEPYRTLRPLRRPQDPETSPAILGAESVMRAVGKGAKEEFGDQPLGHPEEWAKLPPTWWGLQPLVGVPLDAAARGISGAVVGAARGMGEAVRQLGGDDTTAGQAERETYHALNAIMLESMGRGGIRPEAANPLTPKEFLERAEKAPAPAAVEPADLRSTLHAAGYRDDQIDAMSPALRRDAYEQVRAGNPRAMPERPVGEEPASAAPEKAPPEPSAPSAPSAWPMDKRARAAMDDLDDMVKEAATRQEHAPAESTEGAAVEPEPHPEPPAEAAQRAPTQDLVYLSPDDLRVDAKRFQFKGNSDESGVTGALRGVEKWDERLANPILAWEDKNGQLFVANGHQRTDLAKRAAAAGQEGVRIPARILREADGYTPEHMRALGAYQNIAEGTGTAIDAAKILRANQSGLDLPPLPPRSQLVQDARALASLGDNAFGMVVNGVVPDNYAAQVGRALKDPAEQVAAMDALAKAAPDNVEQARIIVEDVKNSGFLKGEESTLFGNEEFARSLVAERARILDRALKTLRRTGGVFKTAVEHEDTLAGAGNKLSREANVKAKTENERLAEILRVDGTRHGPISTALSAAARDLADGKNVNAVTSRFLGQVRSLARGKPEDAQPSAPPHGHGLAEEEGAGPARPAGAGQQRAVGRPIAEPVKLDRGTGEQYVIPGAERAPDRALAQRRAEAPLKPKATQKPADEGLFGSEKNQPDLFKEAGFETSPGQYNYHHLGTFRPDRNQPVGAAAQEYVLRLGKEANVEILVAIDERGQILADGRGNRGSVGASPTLAIAVGDPRQSIMIHHNHPESRSLSRPDIAMLGHPGLRAIWAHGHNGSVYRATLTPSARKVLEQERTAFDAVGLLNKIASDVHFNLKRTIQPRTVTSRVPVADAEAAHSHLINSVLRAAGIIDYHTNFSLPRSIEEADLQSYLNHLARSTARSFFHDDSRATEVRAGPDRPAEPLRHIGDVGTSFGGTETAPGQRPSAGRVDRGGGTGNRGEARPAKPTQLKLLEDADQYREAPDAGRGGSGGAPPRPPAGGGTGSRPPPGGRSVSATRTPKVISQFKNFWHSTFQPELVSDRAFAADPLFARYKAAQAQEKDAIIRQSEHAWDYWNRRPLGDQLAFLDAVERGKTLSDPAQAEMAKRFRAILDANWAEEKRYGSQAAFVEDYMPHIWEKPDEWRAFAEAKSKQVGPTWFQKKRSIDYISDGLEAGLKLKYTNPVDILTHRLLSGVDMRQRMELLHQLKDMGLAWEGAQGGDQLASRGWQTINAPDRKQWVIAPDVQLLWKNAVEAKGLWQAEHLGGSIFRGWMAFKNAWVPVKLALSAFHPLHVLHINYSNGMALAWNDVAKGKDPLAALKHFAEGFYGPIQAAIPGMPHAGKTARAAWAKRPGQQAPNEKAVVALMQDGGFTPQLSEQLKIKAKRQLAESMQKIIRREAGVSDWRKAVSAAMRRPIEILQGPIFEKWIPSLKAAAYLKEAAALIKRRPELLDDSVQRRIALRAIGQQIDSRYGEKFYGTMFWNRYLKDAAIGSFLSLGWNYGFVHQFGGAALEAVTRPAGLLPPFRPSEGRQTARDATNKIPFVLSYVLSSFAILGGMSMALDDEHKVPEGLDWIFPRVGGKNPDGSPRRITHMSYVREAPMLLKHIQERGGNALSGAGEMLWNKLMFQPFHELMTNRNYYGFNIWDENAPVYKQIWQALKYELGEQTNPMSISGAKRAAELSGKPFPSAAEAVKNPPAWLESARAKGVGLAMLGFGPAPAYVERTATQNRIYYLFREHVATSARSFEEGEAAPEKHSARDAILFAQQGLQTAKNNGDQEEIKKARGELKQAIARGVAAGMSPTSLHNLGKVSGDIALFRRLPDADQRAILRDAPAEERGKYLPFAHKKVQADVRREDQIQRILSDPGIFDRPQDWPHTIPRH